MIPTEFMSYHGLHLQNSERQQMLPKVVQSVGSLLSITKGLFWRGEHGISCKWSHHWGQKKYCLKFLITLGEWSTVEETKMCKHEPFLVRHMIYTIIMNVWLFKIIFIEERGKYDQLLWSWRVQCEEKNESGVLGKLTY
jgi:hypothetical protein